VNFLKQLPTNKMEILALVAHNESLVAENESLKVPTVGSPPAQTKTPTHSVSSCDIEGSAVQEVLRPQFTNMQGAFEASEGKAPSQAQSSQTQMYGVEYAG
jgi:hypothetical protein